jgi:hypothetical protein
VSKILPISLAAWIIVAAALRADNRLGPNEVLVFHCKFGEDWDVNYDRWPDRWVRKTGADYPHYVEMELQEDEAKGRCLEINLDGAAASISSPPIRVMSRFSYVLEAELNNEQLERSQVVITVDFYDDAGKLLQSKPSEPVASTNGWKLVRIEVEPNNPAIDRAVVGLTVIRGAKGDLHGRVRLRQIWLARLPRINVATNCPFNVYTDVDDVAVKCELSGIREPNPEIRFQLFDSAGVEHDRGSISLNGRLIHEAPRDAKPIDGESKAPAGYEGSTVWRPKIPGYGYYRIVIKMLSSEMAENVGDVNRELDRERTVRLAVVPPLAMPTSGEFGWSLPDVDKPLSLDHLSRLLPHVGVNWVKLPAWYDATDARRGDDLIRFVELVGASHMDVVGVIGHPPAGSELASRLSADAAIGDILSTESAASWSPSLEPVMTRLALRVRWWQLGREFDTSFAGDPNVNKRIADLRTMLFRFGQDVRLGLCWDWESESRATGDVNWDFQQYCHSTAASQKKLDKFLAGKPENSALRWVLIQPPARGDRPAADQFREFVLQLVSAKEHGADAIIVPHPFDDETGLMTAGGMPAELLFPWRTTGAMLGGAKYLGSIHLPGGSENRVFIRSGGPPETRVVMVVWNEKPTREMIYLGKEIAVYDIFGRARRPELEKHEHVIEAGPEPVFVVGLHEAITRIRMTMDFAHRQVPSDYSKAHPNAIRIHNYFPQGVGGSLSIIVPKEGAEERSADDQKPAESSEVQPERWSIEPPQGSIKLARDADTEFPFEIRLKNDATYGKQPIRVDFQIDADEQYKFSVYREMEVGTGDVTLEVKTYLNDEGVLIVEQLMTNLSEELSDFKCFLRNNNRRPQRTQVYQLGKQLDRQLYRFPNGKELLGKEMLLEIEEVNGERLFRYRFQATDSPDAKESPDNKPLIEPGRGVTGAALDATAA